MTSMTTMEMKPRETALQIGQALTYLVREAEAAGLPTLAVQIESAEAAAYETARQEAYLRA